MLYDILVYYIKKPCYNIHYMFQTSNIFDIRNYILHITCYNIYIILYIVCSVDYMLHITD